MGPNLTRTTAKKYPTLTSSSFFLKHGCSSKREIHHRKNDHTVLPSSLSLKRDLIYTYVQNMGDSPLQKRASTKALHFVMCVKGDRGENRRGNSPPEMIQH